MNSIVTLGLGHDKRLRAGHVWVYRSEIGAVSGDPAPGDIVDVHNAAGHFYGRGYINPRSEITVRLLTREHEDIDEDFFQRRLDAAIQWRRRFLPGETSWRVAYSEGDNLPGLIVDRYEDIVVVQFLTLGMDVHRPEVLAAIRERLQPVSIYERSDAHSRQLEGLPTRTGLLWGQPVPELAPLRENGLNFLSDVAGGQKTGYFLDQKWNRRALQPLVCGERVLDAFCHTGSFGIHAASYGAREVVGFDISSEAVELANKNAALNNLQHVCRFTVANAFEQLRELQTAGEHFGCVVLDPPAFTKSRQAIASARRGYKEVNLRALKLLSPGGFLVTCSCSHHMSADAFWDMLLEAAADARRHLRLVEKRTQCLDHPILAGVRETEYLKCYIVQAF